jgi:uncharacterized membrane protein (DUF373 family)
MKNTKERNMTKKHIKRKVEKIKMIAEGIIVLISLLISHFLNLSIIEVAIYLLNVLLLWEISRMLSSYVMDDEHKMDLRLLVDGFLVIFLRELLVIFSEHKAGYEITLLIIIGIMTFLYLLRRAVLNDNKSFIFLKEKEI